MRAPDRAEGDWARRRVVNEHVELLEATFDRFAYEPHFHDTFAIGVTLHGVQRFRCRGRVHDSLGGDVLFIPPGEVHDGASGSTGGYAYRMLYLSDASVRDIMADALEGGVRIPVRRSTIVRDRRVARELRSAWRAASDASDPLRAEELLRQVIVRVALGFAFDEGDARRRIDAQALSKVRDYLWDHRTQRVAMAEMSAIASMSRFRLTRQFQRAFGLTLHAYHVQLRLHEARRRLQAGERISIVAADLAFVDQSHFHRRFKGTFGVTPGAWRRAAFGRTAIQDSRAPS